MGQHYYHTGQFAQKASVSIRTLRYYDKVGLLSPSQYTEAGYRLYTDPEIPRFFTGRDQAIPAHRSNHPARIACPPESHDAGEKKPA
ncbi:MAG: MerR family DNA-binding transcriptional regulator [Chloroflexi bacterium]|nr:MAG: MerR family DNA-binding transcriptional regulator [Chloroflexota bacterium]